MAVMESKQTRHQSIMEKMAPYPEYRKIYQDWHAIGSVLNESPMSQEQVQAIFKAIADGAKAGGNVAKAGDAPANNRTLLGKGTDAASKIAGKWNDLKTKISQSAPVRGFDTAFDSLQQDVLKSAGGESGKIGKILNGYKKFATKYPKMQGAIYAGLAILAGLSGWGLGVVAITAGLRTLDRLLQGDKLSSAAWAGFKTGAIGAIFSQIGSQIGAPQTGEVGVQGFGDGPVDVAAQGFGDGPSGVAAAVDVGPDYVVRQGDTLSQIAQNNQTSVAELQRLNPTIGPNPNDLNVGQEVKLPSAASAPQSTYAGGVGTDADTARRVAAGQIPASPHDVRPGGRLKETVNRSKIQRIWKLQEQMNLPQQSAVYLTQYGISRIFHGCVKQNLINEGMWDSVKKAAKTGWENVTNKITYSGLDNSWRRNYGDQTAEGSVDSTEVISFLKKNGVLDGLIQKTFSDLKIPMEPVISPDSAAGTAADPAAQAPGPAAPDTDPAAQAPGAPDGSADSISTAPAGGSETVLTPDHIVTLISPVTAQVKDLMNKLLSNQGNPIGNPKVREALKALADLAIDLSNSTGSTSPIKKGNSPGTYAEGQKSKSTRIIARSIIKH